MARTGTTEGVGEILPRLINSTKWKKKYMENLVRVHWKDIVGDFIARHTRLVKLDFKTLFVDADSTGISNELYFQERMMIDRINAYVAAELVTSIRFGTNFGIFKKHLPKKNVLAVDKSSLASPKPTREERERAALASSRIADEDVRDAARSALAKSLAQRRGRLDARYHPCRSCGRLTPPGEIRCGKCEREHAAASRRAIRSLLLEKPYLKYHDLHRILGCSQTVAVSERIVLIQELAARVLRGDESSDEARRLVMMTASVREDELTPDLMGRVLKRLTYDMRK